MNQNHSQPMFDYLKLADSSCHFSSLNLNTIIEDRDTAYAKRINNKIKLVVLQPDDIVMTRTAIQSDFSKITVATLCYAFRGSYQIILITSHSSYFVKKLKVPGSPEQKSMAYDLYFLLSISQNL